MNNGYSDIALVLEVLRFPHISGQHSHFIPPENTWKPAVVWTCSVEKVLFEISQNSQENTCARVSFLMKLQASGLQLY